MRTRRENVQIIIAGVDMSPWVRDYEIVTPPDIVGPDDTRMARPKWIRLELYWDDSAMREVVTVVQDQD